MILSLILQECLNIFHSFNKFLGSDGGAFLTVSVEFILFMLIGYMATSQYLKNKNRQIKYLSISFLTIALVNFISAGFYAATVFGDISRIWVDVIIPPFSNSFEVIALWLLCVALTYQVLRIRIKHLREKFIGVSVLIVSVMMVYLAYWLSTIDSRPYELFIFTPQFHIFVVLKLLIVGSAVVFLVKNYHKALTVEKFTSVIIQALIVYSVPSILHLYNYFFWGMGERLRVLANPFPFIAVFLFIRYSYLKLADKASIMDKLDLTERKYKKIKEVNRLKDEFVSIASHELKTPLTAINLYTSLLSDGTLGSVTNQQKEALLTLKAETLRLTNLVNDLLDLSKIQNRKLILKKNKVDFHKITKETLKGFQAHNPSMKISNRVPKELHAYIDDQRIKQVLINLVSNAAKFTPADGTIEVCARNNQKSFIFSVKDNGKGIPKSKLNYLFQKFYQVDPHLARKEGISGLGLGLSIVKGIIDAHQGEIVVDSAIDKGTKFTIKIPHDINL